MDVTTTVVVLVLWNGLLLAAGLAAIIWRKRLLAWITGGDRRHRSELDGVEGADAWQAFLAEHPELEESDLPVDFRD